LRHDVPDSARFLLPTSTLTAFSGYLAPPARVLHPRISRFRYLCFIHFPEINAIIRVPNFVLIGSALAGFDSQINVYRISNSP
jgi:hypothetical protein